MMKSGDGGPRLFEPSSPALFGDTVPLRVGVNDFLRWKELELDTLLPVNEVDTERNDEEAEMWQPRSMMMVSLRGSRQSKSFEQ